MNAKLSAVKAYIVDNKKALLKKALIAAGAAAGIVAVGLLVQHEVLNSDEPEMLADVVEPVVDETVVVETPVEG